MGANNDETPVITAMRWLLAVIFLVAGGLKAWDPAATIQNIANYHLLPLWLTPLAGLYAPWLEIACGAALFSRKLRLGGWLLALLLSAGFLTFTGSALVRGLDISCGCFGSNSSADHLPWISMLDSIMIFTSAMGLRFSLQKLPSRG